MQTKYLDERKVTLSEAAVHDENSKTFVFENEGHTIGNVLRNIIAEE